MAHNHPHSHSKEKNIGIAVLLNISFTIIELIGGLWTNSLAILSDALHDFGDSVVLIASWILERKSKMPADQKRTFGYQRLSLLSAFFSSIVLVTGSLFILSKAIPRLMNPEHVNATGMIGLAILGIFFNGLGFIRLKKGLSTNEKVLSWHLLEDVLSWTAILIGAIIMQFWDNHLIDPLLTIGFTLFTLWGVIKNLREILHIFLQGVPPHVNLEEIKKAILSIDGVRDVHDVHIWSLEGETNILTCHIAVNSTDFGNIDNLRKEIKELLHEYHIEHSTLEFEDKECCSENRCEIAYEQSKQSLLHDSK